MTHRSGLSIRDGLDLLGAPTSELWWRYVSMGGTLDFEAFESAVRREHTDLAAIDIELIVQTLNEAFLDREVDTFPVGSTTPTPPKLLTLQAQRTSDRANETRERCRSLLDSSGELLAQAAALFTQCDRTQLADRAQERAEQVFARRRSS